MGLPKKLKAEKLKTWLRPRSLNKPQLQPGGSEDFTASTWRKLAFDGPHQPKGWAERSRVRNTRSAVAKTSHVSHSIDSLRRTPTHAVWECEKKGQPFCPVPLVANGNQGLTFWHLYRKWTNMGKLKGRQVGFENIPGIPKRIDAENVISASARVDGHQAVPHRILQSPARISK